MITSMATTSCCKVEKLIICINLQFWLWPCCQPAFLLLHLWCRYCLEPCGEKLATSAGLRHEPGPGAPVCVLPADH